MNAFKKYVRRRHGVKLLCDYECMPCGELDDIYTDSNNARVIKYYYTVGHVILQFTRDGRVIISD